MANETQLQEEIARLKGQLALAEGVMAKSAEYVGVVQPELDRYNEFKDAFAKRAHQVAAILAERGVIEKTAVDQLVDKLTLNGVTALDLVERVSGMIEAPSMGKKAADVSVPSRKMDAFERLALFGDSEADPRSANAGFVE